EGPKVKPKEDEALVPEDGKGGAPEEDEKEVLARVQKNMRASEEKLGNKEVGKPTLQTQRDALKDLDALIARVQNPPQSKDNQGGGGGGGGAQKKSPQGGGGKEAKGGGNKQAQSSGRQARAQRRAAGRNRPG